MGHVLVDSNVLLDVVTEDPSWFDWSSETLGQYAEEHILAIDPVIYGEISIGFERIEDLEEALARDQIERLAIPYEAAFLAGKCFLKYRRRGGKRSSTLPDLFIGAHATVRGIPLITRDTQRYKSYFPQLELVTPR